MELTDSPFEPGTLVNGRYTIIHALGRGGMGSVYAAADGLQPNRALALKVFLGLGESAERLSLFEAEFRTMATLEHPNIARAFDFEAMHGTSHCLITMERIDGLPIDAVARTGWRDIVELAVQVCRALSYLHSRRILHLDLKPANVLIDRSGMVKIVDFGISRETMSASSAPMGTLRYIAPEILLDPASADPRTDLYSLGITLHELLFGAVPFGVQLAKPTARHAVNPAAGTDVPEWLEAVVTRLCARDPSERFRQANDVIEALGEGAGVRFAPETAATRESYVLSPRFTGRVAEIAVVEAFVARRLRASGGDTSLLVSGVSGIGKSRLMQEVRRRLQLSRTVFLEANCYEGSPDEYGPIADLLHQVLAVLRGRHGTGGPGHEPADSGAQLPRLLARGQRGDAATFSDAENERVRLLEGTSDFLVNAARQVPFVLYVNDLQWAGAGTARVFVHLAQRLRDDEAQGEGVPLALIGSYRVDETDQRPVNEALQRLRTAGIVRDITLAPLTRDDTAGIVRSMLGVDEVPQEFLDRLHVESAGNPFFIQEVMRALIENGTVYLDAGKWATHGSIEDLRIPASIADVFRRRFRRLDADLQEAMRILSVQARPMRLELLAEALGSIHEAGRAALALVELGLATRSEGTDIAYRIAHDRMRETIYAEMSEETRRDRHRLVGLALERVTAATRPNEPPLDELAHQLWHAGVLDKALPYALAAGERAMGRFENHAAAEHFDRAVQLLDQTDPRYDEVLERHADMLVRLTRFDAGLTRYHELLARHAGKPRDESRVHGKISDVHMQRSELELAVDYGWRALAVHGEKRPSTRLGWLVLTCREFLVFAATRLRLRRPAGGSKDASAIVELYDNLFRPYFFLSPLRTFYCTLRIWRLGSAAPDLESRACGNSGIAMMIGIVGLRRWSMDLFQQAAHEAEAAASRWWIGGVEMRRGVVQRMEGRWEVDPLDRATATLRDAGHLFDYGAAVFHAADAEYFTGNINGAFERMRRYNLATFRVSEGTPSSARGTLILETTCRALRMEHDIDSRFQQYFEYSLARRDIVVVAALLHDWGQTLVMRDRLHDGLEKLERSYAMWRKHRLVDNYSAEVLYKLPRAYLRLERLDRARSRLLHRVQGKAMRKTRRIHRNWRAPVLVNEALIAEARGQPERADALVTEALEIARRQNAGLFVSDGLHEWARMLMKRGKNDAARERMVEALAIADTGGNQWLAQRCRASLSVLDS